MLLHFKWYPVLASCVIRFNQARFRLGSKRYFVVTSRYFSYRLSLSLCLRLCIQLCILAIEGASIEGRNPSSPKSRLSNVRSNESLNYPESALKRKLYLPE